MDNLLSMLLISTRAFGHSFSVSKLIDNRGQDGSRKVSATLDETGLGKTFSKTLNITQNGDPVRAHLSRLLWLSDS